MRAGGEGEWKQWIHSIVGVLELAGPQAAKPHTGTGPFWACGGKNTVKRIVVPVAALACVYCLNLWLAA